MPNQFIASNLRSLPMFSRLPPEAMNALTDYVLVSRAEAHEVIFRQGTPSRGLYFIVGGSAQLSQTAPDGSERVLAVVGANQFLNDVALVRPAAESATLRALETTIVLLLTRENYLRALTDHPQLRTYLPPSLLPPLPSTPASAPPLSPPPQPAGASPDPTAPTKLFREQRDNETVLIDTRRHWWAFGRQAWLPGLVAGGIFIAAFFAPSFWISLAMVGVAALLPGLLMLYFYFEWRNDHVIVTDQRVIRIERTIPTFETKISDVPLGSIQEVNVDSASLVADLLNFGDVDLKTPGDAGNLRLTMLPNPTNFQKLVFENRARFQEESSRRQRGVLRSEIDQIVAGGAPSALQTAAKTAPDEVIYRKHAIYRLRLAFWPGLLLVFAIGLFFAALILPSLRETVVLPFVAFGLGILAAGWLYWADWDWRNDLYIVGSDTIQIIHRRPLWMQNETEQISLAKVDSVVSDQNGLLESLFDYGTVKISLLGADIGAEKAFQFIGEPQEVQAEIARRIQEMRNRGSAEAERRRRAELAEYLSVYHETVREQNVPTQAAPNPSPQQQQPGKAPLIPEARRIPPVQPGTTPPTPQVRDHQRPPNVPRTRPDGGT